MLSNKAQCKFEYLFILFIINASAMVLELIAARILSPFFGSSNLTWTIIISIILFANAIGNYIGGVISDKHDLYQLKICLLTFISTFLFFLFFLNKMILSTPTGNILFAIIFVFIFLCPNFLFGAISPIVNKASLVDATNVGKTSGKIYVIITFGSLIGTLIGGLYLIPTFGSGSILFLLSILICVVSILSCFINISESASRFLTYFICFVNIVVLLFSVITHFFITPFSASNLQLVDTGDGFIRIYDAKLNGESVRMFEISGGFSSAIYTDKDKENEPVFEYYLGYNTVFDAKSDIRDTCMIGGGGYAYPRYVISHYPDVSMDVVEIDKGVTNAALNYFGLKDFIDEYNDGRLSLYNEDGRQYLSDISNKYDVIFNDSFSGQAPARVLCSIEAAECIKGALKTDGIYAANVFGEFDGYKHFFLESEIKTLLSVFDHVWVYDVPETTNTIIIASDYYYVFDNDNFTDFELDNDSIIYTDDYSPIDYIK